MAIPLNTGTPAPASGSRRCRIAPSRWLRLACLLALGAITSAVGLDRIAEAETKTLDVYFIDVEGGQSTLVVTPDKHSVLIDTGYAGQGTGFGPGDPRQARDANRIVAAARDAGIA